MSASNWRVYSADTGTFDKVKRTGSIGDNMQKIEGTRVHKILCTCVPRGNCLLVDVRDINKKTGLAPEIKTVCKVPSVYEKNIETQREDEKKYKEIKTRCTEGEK